MWFAGFSNAVLRKPPKEGNSVRLMAYMNRHKTVVEVMVWRWELSLLNWENDLT